MNDEMMEMLQSLEKMAGMVSKMEARAKKALCDRITRPNAVYEVQTGPFIFGDEEKDEWITLLVATTSDGKKYGPACVQESHGEDEAHRTHYEWQKTIIECAPMMFRDTKSKTMYFVGS